MEKYSIKLSLEEAQRCKNFADSMINNDSQRPYRSNSTVNRSPKEMQENIYRGKLAELACRKFLLDNKIEVEGDVDFRVLPRGQWDNNYDIQIKELQKRTVDVKSSSNKACNLLLEADDWKYRDGEVFKYNKEPVPSFFLAANVDFNDNIVSFKGYLPKK